MEAVKKRIPNFLTYSRLFLGTLLFFTIKDELNVVSLVLFIIAVLTDIFDGALARRFHVESEFGKNLDPIVDGWFVSWVWLGFVIVGTISLLTWFLGFGYMIITYILEITIIKRVPNWGAKIIYLRPFTYAGLFILTPVILALRIENLAAKIAFLCTIGAVLLLCLLNKKVRVNYFISLLVSSQTSDGQ